MFRSLFAALVVFGWSQAAYATPVACAGGTLDIAASSNGAPVSSSTFNVGQHVKLTAVAAGFSPSSYAWVIEGPHIKDYNEDLGTISEASSPIPWSTTPLAPADLAQLEVSFYWKPSPSQVHPLNAGPVTRNVSLMVASGAASCTMTATFSVERNTTDASRQPEDFYTSNHRAPAETNPALGRVIDEHMYWHDGLGDPEFGPAWLKFLPWHGYFIRRFDEWRAEFGYPPALPWYPGTPLPAGPEVDHSPRLPSYNANANTIPTEFTINGYESAATSHLASFADLDSFSFAFESGYHGQVHCNIGPLMGFGSMCRTSSPKDPMFWRWHGFIDLMYRNYCVVDGIACLSPLPAGSDPWMGDNPADIAAIGQPPSPHPRWISPDIWVRRTLASCTPASPVPGAARDCGSSADHENPLANTVNYVYATLRNDRPNAQRVVYAEVAVYYANASTGLSWPADFTIIPQSRQFITLNLEPGQTVDIGPVEWTPPSPTPSDHWCLYIRIRTIQEPPQAEGANVDINVRDSNSITWRNVRIVTALLAEADVASFLVRNIWPDPQPLSLEIVTPEAIVRGGVTLLPDETLARRIREGGVRIAGLRAVEGGFAITAPKATIAGLTLQPREARVVRLRVTRAAPGEIQVVQRSREGVDGGVTIQVRRARQRGSRRR